MIKKTLFIAPHPDDETLGCGGTILRFADDGFENHWVIVTDMKEEDGFDKKSIAKREEEIEKVSQMYGFSDVHRLGYPAAKLDRVCRRDLIESLSRVIRKNKPKIVFAPFRNDVHDDHKIVYDATIAATKSFRYPFIEKILSYETISETDYGQKPGDLGYKPNLFINIEEYLDKKLEIMSMFESELGEFPFPRSIKAISSLAYLRGSQSNFRAAESFMLVKEIM